MTEPTEANSQAPLPLVLQEAIGKYVEWLRGHLLSEQEQNTIDTPLYHYTDGQGLTGILKDQKLRFTDYRHMNDPSELIYGIQTARDALKLVATGADGRVEAFLNAIAEMLSDENLSMVLEFFTVSFSRERDDLGQWRAYADNGRGYAIGFAPRLFQVVDEPNPQQHEAFFVGPVVYGATPCIARHRLAIERAAEIFLDALEMNADLMRDRAIGIPFIVAFRREVIAGPLIWNCLTSKHPAYAHEREVRLIKMGQRDRLMPYIKTRLRGSEIVPYLEHATPMRHPQDVFEIVAGPATPTDAERTVRTLLNSLGVDPSVQISRSDIPYRP